MFFGIGPAEVVDPSWPFPAARDLLGGEREQRLEFRLAEAGRGEALGKDFVGIEGILPSPAFETFPGVAVTGTHWLSSHRLPPLGDSHGPRPAR
jgi:hypothetical protein